ncbi:MAG: hypothetical protein RPU52_12475 [Candidatus Sedimenticola sp. (ex Thyasira tokunagai)]
MDLKQAMAINSITGAALQGIQRGLQNMRRSTSEIASANALSGRIASKDMVRSMVELHQSSHHTTASVKAFKATDAAIGSLLDIKA